MTRHLKINTALVLCTVFVFKMVAGMGITSSLSTVQRAEAAKVFQALVAADGKSHVSASDHSPNAEYSVAEITEENANDGDEQFKSFPFTLIQVLYSQVAGETEDKLRDLPFFSHHTYSATSRYLVFQVFRI